MTNAKLNFTLSEYEKRISDTRVAMEIAGVDTIIVSDPSNMNWLTGYDGWSFYVHQAVVLGAEGAPIWFGRGMDRNGALRTCFMDADDMIGYADEYVQSTTKHPMEALGQLLTQKGWHKGRIGVEMDNYWFSAKAFATMEQALPNVRFVDTTGLVNWQRSIKSETELNYMRTAGKIVSRMHERIFDVVEPGMRKCDLVAEIYDASLRYDDVIGAGGDYAAFVPMLPSGKDASAPHLTWDDSELKAGEGTFFEIGGAYKRYQCPLSRTVFLGKPPSAFLDAEKAVIEGMEAGLEKAKPGNKCEDIAIAFFDSLAKAGFEKDSRTGYSIGLSYPPDWGERTMSLRRGDKTELKENMVFHFMPGLWMDDWGIEITESIAITESGAECLANVPRNLVIKP